jgi:hypothetical protein
MSNDEGLAKRISELEAKIEAQRAELDALKPPEPDVPKSSAWPVGVPRIDYTSQMVMPASAAKAMAKIVPDVKSGGFDAHAHAQTKAPFEVSGFGPPGMHGPAKPVERGSGYVKAQPLTPPSGLRHVDAIAEHFAAIDKGEAIKQVVAAAIGKGARDGSK